MTPKPHPDRGDDASGHEQLIVYAEPQGALGARCAEFWAAVSAAEAATSAQEYPPHVSLTGFFGRHPARRADVVDAFTAALDEVVPAGLDGSRWAGPVTTEYQANDEWIGFHVQASWMDALIAAFVADPRTAPDAAEDPVRPKSWLHLSLAYGDGFADGRPVAEAESAPFADVRTETAWSLAVWRRDAHGWERLAHQVVHAAVAAP